MLNIGDNTGSQDGQDRSVDSLKFSCPGCGQHIECDATYRGMVIACPSCAASMQVSASPETSTSHRAGQLNEERLSTVPSPRSGLSLLNREGGAGSQTELGFTQTEEEEMVDLQSIQRGGMFAQLEATRDEIHRLHELRQPRPGRLKGLRAFLVRSTRAIRLVFTEKELIAFGLLQWAVIGIVYYLWLQVLGWIPEETWAAARDSDDISGVDIAFTIWSVLCIGLAAFPLGILSGCMGAVQFLNRQGRESTIATCLKIVMPHAFRLWIFHWADGVITCKQILERLPKKNDGNSPRINRAVSEALYYAWKLGTAGILPGLVLGQGLFEAGKNSVLLVKNRFMDMTLLRAGYSALCWAVGILAYIGGVAFFFYTDFFGKTEHLAQGIQIHQFYQLAGVPMLVAVGLVVVFLRPLFVISLCDIYAEEIEARGEHLELVERPSRGTSALVAFGVTAGIVLTGGLYLKPFLFKQNATLIASQATEETENSAQSSDLPVTRVPEAFALRFDGIDDWLELSPIAWDTLPSFTIEAWVRDWRGKLIHQGKEGDPENSVYLSLGPTKSKDTSGWEHGRGKNVDAYLGTAETGRWIHVAMVFDGSSQSLYYHGQLKNRVLTEPPGPMKENRSLAIGRSEKNQKTGAYGAGLLRTLRISSVARYSADFEPTESWTADPQTLVLLQADQRQDQMLTDLSNQRNNAKIHGATVETLSSENSVSIADATP